MVALTKAEVLAKCTPELVASSDEGAMARVINDGRTTSWPVAVLDVKAYLHRNNLWLPIKVAAAGMQSATQMSALALIEFASSGVANMDTTLPIIAVQLGYLVSGGVIKQSDKDAIIAMGTAADLVSPYDVAVALQGA